MTVAEPPVLVALGGLPGTGKTTVARGLAEASGAALLRIDTIEQAIRGAGVLAGEVGPAGYAVAAALAVDNLALGRSVVADSVNPVAATRNAWREAAARAGAALLEVEIVCSEPGEHRRRVETRPADIPGHVLPLWRDVVERGYEPWPEAALVIDTATVAAGCRRRDHPAPDADRVSAAAATP